MFKKGLLDKLSKEELEVEMEKEIDRLYLKKEQMIQVYIVFMGLMLSCASQSGILEHLFSVFFVFLVLSVLYYHFLPCYSIFDRLLVNALALFISLSFSFYVISLSYYYFGYTLSFDLHSFYFENFSYDLFLMNFRAYFSFLCLFVCVFMTLLIDKILLFNFER